MDDQQRARELWSDALRKVGQHEFAYHVGCGGDLDLSERATLDTITAALRAAPDELAERHAAAERDACRWARIAEEHRDGRLAALERVAELEAKLRAAPEGFVIVRAGAVKPSNCGADHHHCCRACGADLGGISARPQGVKDAS